MADTHQVIARLVAGESPRDILQNLADDIVLQIFAETCAIVIKIPCVSNGGVTILPSVGDGKCQLSTGVEHASIVRRVERDTEESSPLLAKALILVELSSGKIADIKLCNETETIATIYVPLRDKSSGVLHKSKPVLTVDNIIHHMNMKPEIYDAITLVAMFVRLDATGHILATSRASLINSIVVSLKSPLGGVVSAIKRIDGKGLDCEVALRKSSKDLFEIINDIGDLATIESGQLQLHPTVFPLFTCLSEVVEIERQSATAKGIKLLLIVAPEVPLRVIIDYTRLRQILLNIVDNAVKYTKCGSVVVIVSAIPTSVSGASGAGGAGGASGASDTSYQLNIYVKDTGCGIDDEIAEKIFIPFGSHDGKGLGLSISQKIAQIMGGDITIVETKKDKGTTMLISVSAMVPRVVDLLDVKYIFESKSILILHSMPAIRIAMCKKLESWGLSCITCGTTEEAVELYMGQYDFSLIMSEVGLAYGKESIINIIRTNMPNVPVIEILPARDTKVAPVVSASSLPVVITIGLGCPDPLLFQTVLNIVMSDSGKYSAMFEMDDVSEARRICQEAYGRTEFIISDVRIKGLARQKSVVSRIGALATAGIGGIGIDIALPISPVQPKPVIQSLATSIRTVSEPIVSPVMAPMATPVVAPIATPVAIDALPVVLPPAKPIMSSVFSQKMDAKSVKIAIVEPSRLAIGSIVKLFKGICNGRSPHVIGNIEGFLTFLQYQRNEVDLIIMNEDTPGIVPTRIMTHIRQLYTGIQLPKIAFATRELLPEKMICDGSIAYYKLPYDRRSLIDFFGFINVSEESE